MLASYHGRVALVQELLHPSTASSKTTLKRKSANPNVLNDRMQSCLAGAIFKDETEIIKLLLAAGANPDIGKPTADETGQSLHSLSVKAGTNPLNSQIIRKGSRLGFCICRSSSCIQG